MANSHIDNVAQQVVMHNLLNVILSFIFKTLPNVRGISDSSMVTKTNLI